MECEEEGKGVDCREGSVSICGITVRWCTRERERQCAPVS